MSLGVLISVGAAFGCVSGSAGGASDVASAPPPLLAPPPALPAADRARVTALTVEALHALADAYRSLPDGAAENGIAGVRIAREALGDALALLPRDRIVWPSRSGEEPILLTRWQTEVSVPLDALDADALRRLRLDPPEESIALRVDLRRLVRRLDRVLVGLDEHAPVAARMAVREAVVFESAASSHVVFERAPGAES